jgi:hypothetical protein
MDFDLVSMGLPIPKSEIRVNAIALQSRWTLNNGPNQ